MLRNTTIINFSAPHRLAKLIKQQARLEQKTQSELLRDAFAAYMYDERLKKLQAIGTTIAQKLGFESFADIENYLG